VTGLFAAATLLCFHGESRGVRARGGQYNTACCFGRNGHGVELGAMCRGRFLLCGEYVLTITQVFNEQSRGL
jgi:hypothetical protein